ncbi:MAG: ribosome-associated translation inhibitor RaiA [Patescibacteria group bacterium]
MLNYNIKGTEVQVSDELRAYVERALAHAEKFLAGDSSAHVDVELEYSPLHDPSFAEASKDKGGKYRAEFTVSASGAIYRAEAWGSTLHEAIDLTIAELGQELRRTKDKRRHFLRRGALKVKEFVRGFRNRF